MIRILDGKGWARMSLVDLESADWEGHPALVECDVCIVGTGPAGSTIARELSNTGLRVTVVESGGFQRDPNVDRLNDVVNVGRARAEDQWSVRNRIVGGSSYTWGGRCAPFDEIDFEQREWVPGSGWPLKPEDLTQYLDRSAEHLGLGTGTGFNDSRFWALADRKPPPESPDPAILEPFFWQFSRDDDETYPFEYMRFGRRLLDRVGANVTVAINATVVRVELADSGRSAAAITVAAPDGRRHTLRAKTIVLCAGGIENARILLSSGRADGKGLGNDRDHLGRYLMDHPRGPIGRFEVEGSRALQKRLGRYNVGRNLFRAGFRLGPTVQRDEGLVNCSAWLGETVAEDDPWDALRRLLGRGAKRRRDFLGMVRGAPLMARGVNDYFIERNGFPRKYDALDLMCMCEQVPDPDSRVTLSEERDKFGVQLPQIDWRVHPDESRSVRRMAKILETQLPQLGLPAPILAEWILDGGELPETFRDVAHPTGTTRMSENPEDGVVDPDGRVHGIDNLYVAGTSVFPTAGHCNPTQMIVAMAIRLADHLKWQVPFQSNLEIAERRPGRDDKSAPHVLLTGATGRIGRVVLRDLLERGYHVRATSTRPQEAHEDSDNQLEWREFDFRSSGVDEYMDLVAGCDGVIHLAAAVGRQEDMPAINVQATGALALAAERSGVRAFCYTSSISVYGSGRRRSTPEDAPVLTCHRDVPGEYGALEYVRTYGRTKLAGERALSAVARNVSYAVLRPAVVVDVDQLIEIREWSRLKKSLGAHRHAHHVFAADVSDALIWALERADRGTPQPGTVETFNVAEDDCTSPRHRDFMRKARQVSGDDRFRAPFVPGVVDWLYGLARFRQSPLRRPLWRMRFPGDKLYAAGYRFPYGMSRAHELAFEKLAATGEHRT